MNKDKKNFFLLFMAASFALLTITLVAGRYISVFSASVVADQEMWGQFGDYFGGILNPILSFFAFVALLVTLRLQISSNRESDRRHEEITFDSRLFQLLSLTHECASGVRLYNSSDLCSGHHALNLAWVRLSSNLKGVKRGSSPLDFDGLRDQFTLWKAAYWPAVSSYYETIIFTIEFIEMRQPDPELTEFSIKAVISQMTVQERHTLLYVLIFSGKRARLLLILMACGCWDEKFDDPLLHLRGDFIKASLVVSHLV